MNYIFIYKDVIDIAYHDGSVCDYKCIYGLIPSSFLESHS